MSGIMLDHYGDLMIRPHTDAEKKILSGLLIDDTLIQDAAIVLGMNQGELKEDPALGPCLLRQIRAPVNKAKIEKSIQIHLKRAGIDYDELINKIQLNINNEQE